MFLTMDSHEERISSMLAGPGARCWRTVQLNLSIPFFFPTWVVQEDDLEVSERALLIYESDFLDLFESVGPQSLRHVQYLTPMESDPDRWEICRSHAKKSPLNLTQTLVLQVILLPQHPVLALEHGKIFIFIFLLQKTCLAKKQRFELRKFICMFQ